MGIVGILIFFDDYHCCCYCFRIHPFCRIFHDLLVREMSSHYDQKQKERKNTNETEYYFIYTTHISPAPEEATNMEANTAPAPHRQRDDMKSELEVPREK